MALQQLAEAARGNDSLLTLILLPRLDKATRAGIWRTALPLPGCDSPAAAGRAPHGRQRAGLARHERPPHIPTPLYCDFSH